MAENLMKPFTNIYESETARQNTFIYLNWPSNAPVWPLLLVKAGFYYQGKEMDVTCFSCGVRTSVKDWTRNVHPQQMHFKLNPDCKFIRSLLKPEGGPQTFNDEKKWELSGQEEKMETNETENINTFQKNVPKDNLDCETNRSVPALDKNEGNMGYISNQRLSPFIQQSESGMYNSQDSGFQTNQPSIIMCDSGPPGSLTAGSLLISGSSHFTPSLCSSYVNNNSSYIPSASVIRDSTSDISSVKSVKESIASAGIQSTITRPGNVVFKHPHMEKVSDRMDTFETWPHNDVQPARVLVTAGFFFTMEHDIVRCFSCDLGLSEWDENDDAWREHARHSPKCWYLIRVKGQNYIDEIQKDWKKIYNPKFPNLMEEADRIKTFNSWPILITRPTSVDIAKAGFFFTGRGDECRCHYCDGGLQHWENGDDPWEQHAYYFPFCKFVIKMKGREFINQVRERFEARGPEVDALLQESEEAEAALNRDDIRDRKIKELLAKSEFKDILNFGYSKKAVKMAAEEVFVEKGDFNFTPEHVLNKILDIQDRGEEIPADDDDEDEKTEKQEKELIPADEFMKQLEQIEPLEDAEKVLEENKKLKENLMCWKCNKKEICMLFTPCGHRLTCEDCAKLMHHCLKCKRKVKKKYKTYLA